MARLLSRVLLSILISCSHHCGVVVVVLAAKEPCREPGVSQFSFCNASLATPDRVQDLISRLTLDEKIDQLMHLAPAIDRFRIDPYNWWSESLHGILLSRCTDDGRCATSYPNPINVGATFNMALVQKMASQISSEGRRLFVDSYGSSSSSADASFDRHTIGLDFWGPNINVFRDPRWGRGMETPGEDPYLNGRYAVMYVRGMQEGEDYPRHIKTVATLKHYAAYSLENWNGVDRFEFDAIVSDEDLAQTYLPAFEMGIREGRAGSVMCSYNAVNGVPSCANQFLLRDILRQEWDWDGYVVSDCGAISVIVDRHKYSKTPEEAVSSSLRAGTDLNCGRYYEHAREAIRQGLLDEADIDRALGRLFGARFKLGMFDPWEEQPYLRYPPETVGHPDHVDTALQIARESIVLLKNDNGALPLHLQSTQKVALLGPHFNATTAFQGNYQGEASHIVSPWEGITDAFTSHVVGMQGCDVSSNNTDGFDRAIEMAKSADVAILFLGLNTHVENEGKDRTDLALPGVQEEFLEAIAEVQARTILVLINGGPVDVSVAVENPNVVAILEAFYPGMQGGTAIADVLVGRYNPSGRLPYTIHKKDFVDQMSFLDMSMSNYPGRTYRYFRGEVLFPFGYGLSYTTFKYETSVVESSNEKNQGPAVGATYRVRVTNTGDAVGDTSVLAFLSYKGSQNDFSCPQKQLFGFHKIHLLNPGRSSEVFITASPIALRCVQISNGLVQAPEGWYSVQIGDARHDFLYQARPTRDAEME